MDTATRCEPVRLRYADEGPFGDVLATGYVEMAGLVLELRGVIAARVVGDLRGLAGDGFAAALVQPLAVVETDAGVEMATPSSPDPQRLIAVALAAVADGRLRVQVDGRILSETARRVAADAIVVFCKQEPLLAL